MLDLHARLSRPTIGFKHLLIDPTTIDDHNWELNSPEVRSVARELEYLADAVKIQVQPGLPLEALQIFEEAYNRCMVALWPTLILWLDFLHPMHHKGTPRHGCTNGASRRRYVLDFRGRWRQDCCASRPNPAPLPPAV